MRFKFAIAALILFLSAGCGRGGGEAVENPVDDSLDAIDESLSEAIDCARSLTAPPPALDPTETTETADLPAAPDMVAPLPAALGVVVKAAQDLVTAAAGMPIETDAKAILSAAQELETKAKSGVAPATIEQGLQALLSKTSELRQQR